MRLGFIICLALLLSGYYLDNGILDGQTLPKTSRPTSPPEKAKPIKAIYKQHCVKCHGIDGRAHTAEGDIAGAQDFTKSEWRDKVGTQRIINSITHGRGQMPAFGKKLREEQIKSLSVFVLAFK